MSTVSSSEEFFGFQRNLESFDDQVDWGAHRLRWRSRWGHEEVIRRESEFQERRDPYNGSAKELSLAHYMKYASQFRLLTHQEEVQLAERALNGDEGAREKLVLSNLRLVVKFAKRYKDRGIDFEDLVQEGNLGLIRASQSFDPSKGTRFSTYACMWIIQFISRMVDNKSRSIRLPIRVHKDIRTVKQIIERVKLTRGTEPSIEEIVKISKLSESRVKAAFKNMISPISLNQETGFENTSELGDQIAYNDGDDVESPVEQQLSEEFVRTLIGILTPEENKVISERYGLTGNSEIGFKELSERTGIPLGKVKRIHAIALKKMKRKANLLSETRGMTKVGYFALPG
ncbi:RNA polymerase sigma factor RpoD/SigA [Candidatus Obscuribacterales bacterium]|nr:RNA polymerase sigma factor RpoD/SigA [Candidatus Obscuribacterales bacterium]